MKPSPPLVLASASPRRAEILRMLGLEFEVASPDVEERREGGEAPLAYVERLAREKARCVADQREDALVVGGDTIVIHRGRVLEKPRSERDAVRMLKRLSGESHAVHTALAIVCDGRAFSRVASALVFFRALGADEIRAYAATGEPLDKAGAYGVQGMGASLVARTEGDHYAIVGFSVHAWLGLLAEAGLRYAPGKPPAGARLLRRGREK